MHNMTTEPAKPPSPMRQESNMCGIDQAPPSVERWRFVRLWWVPVILLASGGLCWPAERPTDGPTRPLGLSSPPNIPHTKGAFLGYEAAIRIGLDRYPLLRRSKETALAAEA